MTTMEGRLWKKRQRKLISTWVSNFFKITEHQLLRYNAEFEAKGSLYLSYDLKDAVQVSVSPGVPTDGKFEFTVQFPKGVSPGTGSPPVSPRSVSRPDTLILAAAGHSERATWVDSLRQAMMAAQNHKHMLEASLRASAMGSGRSSPISPSPRTPSPRSPRMTGPEDPSLAKHWEYVNRNRVLLRELNLPPSAYCGEAYSEHLGRVCALYIKFPFMYCFSSPSADSPCELCVYLPNFTVVDSAEGPLQGGIAGPTGPGSERISGSTMALTTCPPDYSYGVQVGLSVPVTSQAPERITKFRFRHKLDWEVVHTTILEARRLPIDVDHFEVPLTAPPALTGVPRLPVRTAEAGVVAVQGDWELYSPNQSAVSTPQQYEMYSPNPTASGSTRRSGSPTLGIPSSLSSSRAGGVSSAGRGDGEILRIAPAASSPGGKRIYTASASASPQYYDEERGYITSPHSGGSAKSGLSSPSEAALVDRIRELESTIRRIETSAAEDASLFQQRIMKLDDERRRATQIANEAQHRERCQFHVPPTREQKIEHALQLLQRITSRRHQLEIRHQQTDKLIAIAQNNIRSVEASHNALTELLLDAQLDCCDSIEDMIERKSAKIRPEDVQFQHEQKTRDALNELELRLDMLEQRAKVGGG